MIIDRHYDDETLIALLAADRPDSALHDAHLASCTACTSMLESYRSVAAVLGEESVWDQREFAQEPPASTLELLRSAASARQGEASTASQLVAALLECPESTWESVTADASYATVGVVRGLIAASEGTIGSAPPRAVEIASLASTLAERLDPSRYQGDAVMKARGAAWRQYAYALFYVGATSNAVGAIERAQQAFDACAVADYDLARLDIVRSVVASELERSGDAMTAIRRSAAVFQAAGDLKRLASARTAEAYQRIESGDVRGALAILRTTEAAYGESLDANSRGRIVGNIALCLARLGDAEGAIREQRLTAALFEESGSVVEAIRVRDTIAGLLASSGRLSDALIEYRRLKQAYESFGMQDEALATGLQIAEILLSRGEYGEVEGFCRAAIDHHRRHGAANSRRILTALAFLEEAAAQRRATPEAVQHVAAYIRRLPKEPELLFLPLPL